jgi:hypothetical protein
MNKLFKKNEKGVILMELIVSLALFSIAVIVILTLLSMGITAQRKVLALQSVQDNARFLLEFIVKEVRMGVISNSSASALDIINQDGNAIRYSFINGNIERRTVPGNQGGAINSTDVIVSGNFYTAGIGTTDNLEPKVTILLSVQGSGAKIEEQARINLQTTLSQRTLDIP